VGIIVLFKNADKAEWEEMGTVLFFVIRKKKKNCPHFFRMTRLAWLYYHFWILL